MNCRYYPVVFFGNLRRPGAHAFAGELFPRADTIVKAVIVLAAVRLGVGPDGDRRKAGSSGPTRERPGPNPIAPCDLIGRSRRSCASGTAYQRRADCPDEDARAIRDIMLDVRDSIAMILDRTSIASPRQRGHREQQIPR